MIPSIDKEFKSNERQKICYICKKKLKEDAEDKKCRKVRALCHCTGKYRGAVHSMCNLRESILKEITVIFNNRLDYDCHFIIKEFEGDFNCLGENQEKYTALKKLNQKSYFTN